MDATSAFEKAINEGDEVCSEEQATADPPESDLLYKVDDVPIWYQCLLFGFQVIVRSVPGAINFIFLISFMVSLQLPLNIFPRRVLILQNLSYGGK